MLIIILKCYQIIIFRCTLLYVYSCIYNFYFVKIKLNICIRLIIENCIRYIVLIFNIIFFILYTFILPKYLNLFSTSNIYLHIYLHLHIQNIYFHTISIAHYYIIVELIT